MSVNNNPQAKRLYDSIRENADINTAEELAKNYPLSKSADTERKFKWAEDICGFLEDNFDEITILRIRESCYCVDVTGKAAKLKSLLHKSKNLPDFADKFNAADTSSKLEVLGDSLLIIYPVCYCSCVKRVDKPLSKTWCYCTLGYTKSLFEKVFDHPVKAELLESIKSGGDRCVIKVTVIS